MAAVTVALDRVTVQLGSATVLNRVSASFLPGTITAVIGGDGSGKSVLLQLLTGRIKAKAGSLTGIPSERRTIGYQPADAGVWRNLSVDENLQFVARVYGMDPELARSRSCELLRRAGLELARGRLAGQLSGGMRQKLGVILATLHQPGLVILDEPSTGVDPISRSELWTLIATTAAEGATVVFATTYLDEAERATSLILLGGGNVLAAGAPDAVIASTPGSIWETPAAGAAVSPAAAAATSWRRADTAYLWNQHADGAVPAGYTAAAADLENTSIALLLEAEAAAGELPDDDTGARSDTAAGTARATGDAPAGGRAVRRDRARQTPRAGAPLVSATNVVRTFDTFAALAGVSLVVRPGEIVGLLGGNGAGKTTLMRILLGVDAPTTGSTALFGAAPDLAARRRLGYVSQGLGLYAGLSPRENVEFAAAVHEVPVPARAGDFARWLGPEPVAELPLGTQRTLAFWAATVHTPELLVLDEPTSGMDALTRVRLWRELRATAGRGTGVLVTTHYMQEAAQCDRLVILTDGRVTAAGTVTEITGSHGSVTVTCEAWDRAFTLLRAAGLPALLHGRALRVPGTTIPDVAAALIPLAGSYEMTTGAATLEETMLMDALDARAPRLSDQRPSAPPAHSAGPRAG